MRGKPGKVHTDVYMGVLSTSSNVYLSHFLTSKIKKRQYVLAGLIFDRSAFSNAKIFCSNFVNKFPNFF